MFEHSLVITDTVQKKVIHVIAITSTPFNIAKKAIQHDYILRALRVMSEAGLEDDRLDVSGDVFEVFRKHSVEIASKLSIDNFCQFGKYMLQFAPISIM